MFTRWKNTPSVDDRDRHDLICGLFIHPISSTIQID